MFDPKQLLDQLLGSRVPGTDNTVREAGSRAVDAAERNPLAAGAIAAILLGTGPGRSLTTSALKLGGLAAIAGLGYQAYQDYQRGNRPGSGEQGGDPSRLPGQGESAFHLDQQAADPDFALLLVRVMIAAAAADGHIDAAERQRILGKLRETSLDAEAQAFLQNEIDDPAGFDVILAAATSDERKVEIYTAARIAVDPDTRAERGYLDLLAGRLGLPDKLIEHIEATVSAAKT